MATNDFVAPRVNAARFLLGKTYNYELPSEGKLGYARQPSGIVLVASAPSRAAWIDAALSIPAQQVLAPGLALGLGPLSEEDQTMLLRTGESAADISPVWRVLVPTASESLSVRQVRFVYNVPCNGFDLLMEAKFRAGVAEAPRWSMDLLEAMDRVSGAPSPISTPALALAYHSAIAKAIGARAITPALLAATAAYCTDPRGELPSNENYVLETWIPEEHSLNLPFWGETIVPPPAALFPWRRDLVAVGIL